MEDPYQKLLSYALYLIAKKRYTEKQLVKKLVRKKIGTAKDIDKVSKRLKELDYINDYSFAKDYILTRINVNPRGIRLLHTELKLKGVSEDIIQKAILKQDIDEEEIARNILERRKRMIAKYSEKEQKQKIYALLARRGISIETIYKVMER